MSEVDRVPALRKIQAVLENSLPQIEAYAEENA